MKDIENALKPYYAVATETTGKGLTVERMERLMSHLGNPERRYPVIHIAGTSGKTSTTYYTAALLRTTGKKIGHTVSPHIESLNERIQINGSPLTDEQFIAYMNNFLKLVKTAPEVPSWFECLLAFAFWVFAVEKVDYAVIETGMGGLHDATNVCKAMSKLCLITDIGLDHQKFLGNDLMSIASQKAGIIHEGNVVLTYEQSDVVMKAIYFKVSQTEKAELYVQQQVRLDAAIGRPFPEHMPLFQRRNWLLAYAAYRFIKNRDSLLSSSADDIDATMNLQVPARMERIVIGDQTVVLDGAHNAAKMAAFVESFVAEYGSRRVPVLLALKKDKDFENIIPEIAKICSKLIITTFTISQDWPIEAINTAEIIAATERSSISDVIAIEDAKDAFEELTKTSDDVVVITGSFYLISQLRKAMVV